MATESSPVPSTFPSAHRHLVIILPSGGRLLRKGDEQKRSTTVPRPGSFAGCRTATKSSVGSAAHPQMRNTRPRSQVRLISQIYGSGSSPAGAEDSPEDSFCAAPVKLTGIVRRVVLCPRIWRDDAKSRGKEFCTRVAESALTVCPPPGCASRHTKV